MNVCRPPIVVLENVKGAPWDSVAEIVHSIGYHCVHTFVDTKDFYLPQTRERGYMFCADHRHSDGRGLLVDVNSWKKVLGSFKRPASSPVSRFILDENDRRLETTERDLSERLKPAGRKFRKWDSYQVRHQETRLEEKLGHKRPVTRWQENGTCQMPDFAWHTWCYSQPDRVWDTVDTNFLRKVIKGYDMNYKE